MHRGLFFCFFAAFIFSGCAGTGVQTPDDDCRGQLDSARAKIAKLEAQPTIGFEILREKAAQTVLQNTAVTKEQKAAFAEYEGFIRWLSGTLSGYENMLHTSAQIATVTRFLPIPYAGQASGFAKFAANFTLQQAQTSAAVTAYNDAAAKYLKLTAEYEAAKTAQNMEKCIIFANDTLTSKLSDASEKLEKIEQMSTSLLSFFAGIDGYMQSADDMMSRAKSLLGQEEKSPRAQVQERSSSLRAKLDSFDKKIKATREAAAKQQQLSKNGVLLLGLSNELQAKAR